MLYFSISGADQADIDLYLKEAHQYQDSDGGGSVVPGIESELHVSRGKAQSYLMDEQSVAALWMNLQNIVASITASKSSPPRRFYFAAARVMPTVRVIRDLISPDDFFTPRSRTAH